MRIFGMGPVELLIIVLIILVIFGPMLIKRFKKSGKELKTAIDETREAWNEEVSDEEPAPKKAKKKAAKLPEVEEDEELYADDEPEEEPVPVRKRTRHEE